MDPWLVDFVLLASLPMVSAGEMRPCLAETFTVSSAGVSGDHDKGPAVVFGHLVDSFVFGVADALIVFQSRVGEDRTLEACRIGGLPLYHVGATVLITGPSKHKSGYPGGLSEASGRTVRDRVRGY